MKKKIFKNVVSLAILCLVMAPVFSLAALPALAQESPESKFWGGYYDEVDTKLALGSQDPRVMAA
ncbi:MAG: hypothetical protein ABH830_02645, partial [Patescibacteria group bacterium]